MGGSPPHRVLIAEDEAIIRLDLKEMLQEEGLEVVGEASDGLEAVEAVLRRRPDVVLMDIRMPRLDGLEATRRIAGEQGVHVLILTTFDVDDYVYEALRAGASGFLLKDVTGEDLVAAVRVVAAGDGLLAPSVTRRVIEQFARRPVRADKATTRLETLTSRERETLELLARGLSNAEIAARLYVSEATVKTHVAHVLMKLGLRDRVQAVIFSYEAGLVVPGE